ncbi:MAG: hypothetical protein JSW65_03040 [Candidatus Bipolaricaulota bacterium]|nr:MAG: hypothetical protein JSW65_03040 [Candidatus Bipolaricaulota bacterium]
MRPLRTLLWLEWRRSRLWAATLLASLLFWAWGLHQVRFLDVGRQVATRAGLLSLAAGIGAIVLCLMIGRIRSETRHGQYQVLLLTPPTGYAHVLARFGFAIATAVVYYVILGGLFWWTFARAGVGFDAEAAIELLLSCPLYGVGLVVAPALAWTMLLMVFISAYRVSGPGWVPGTVMILASPFLLRWIVDGLARVAYELPGWRLLDSVRVAAESLPQDPEMQIELVRASYLGVPQEPFWGMIALTAIMLLIAGRLWQEVEG